VQIAGQYDQFIVYCLPAQTGSSWKVILIILKFVVSILRKKIETAQVSIKMFFLY